MYLNKTQLKSILFKIIYVVFIVFCLGFMAEEFGESVASTFYKCDS
jgi:hypothetical protein